MESVQKTALFGTLVEITGRRRLALDGCRHVTLCEEDALTVDTVDGALRVCGRALTVECLTGGKLAVSGQLLSVEFL